MLRLVIRNNLNNIEIFLRYPGATDDEQLGLTREFVAPLTPADLDDLRFYLEDYAQLPVGEFLARGERVETEQLARWGEALYAAVFGGEGTQRDAYVKVCTALSENKPVDVVIRSYDPRFLGLPWELMKAPEDYEPLSVRVRSFDRSLLLQNPAREFPDLSDGFRVLMVIARPEGTDDVPFQAVARPLFQHLEKHDGPVKIDVLRPPSFAAFRKALTDTKDGGHPYHAVHFDGHGVFGALQEGNAELNPNFFQGLLPQGFVLFEKEAGGKDLISADDFAAALTSSGVPLVILNACRSGMVDTSENGVGPEASIATRLLQDGAASVIAMSHKVYVVAAAAFIAALYEALLAGKSVSEATNIGRRALRVENNRWRPSLKGRMKLQDWMVPVHYARSALALPVMPQARYSPMEHAAQIFAEAQTKGAESGTDPLAAEGGVFFGRDNAFFALERIVRTKRAAVIHGVAGVGKTELAKSFARWLQISGGLDGPRLVFFHEFNPGMATFGLDGVLADIMGRFGQSELYLQLPDTKARAVLVLRVLTQMRCLLVWDNFETVASMSEPGQAALLLDTSKRQELTWFIDEVKKTKTAILMTSRSDERWLGGPGEIARLEIGGLAPSDAMRYADHLLSPHVAAITRRGKEPQSFKALIDHLGGHPLSLRLILPHMATESPAALLEALKGLRDLPEYEVAEGRRTQQGSLTASIAYSFRHLAEADQRRSVILSLFEKTTSANILGSLQDAPDRIAGLDVKGWDDLLSRLANLGLMTRLGGGLYRMHPALPSFLASTWRKAAGEAYAEEREKTLTNLIIAAAIFTSYLHQRIERGHGRTALLDLTALRLSLCAFLLTALESSAFAEAQAIIQSLNYYWTITGYFAEADYWLSRATDAVEGKSASDSKIKAAAQNLWRFAKSAKAHHAHKAHKLETAEAINREIAESLGERNTDEAALGLAKVYHHFGIVAADRNKADEAEYWSKRAIEIFETLGEQSHMAAVYHQIGIVAELRSQFDIAEGWYKKALALNEAAGNQHGMALAYGQLGSVARDQGRLEEAEDWCKKALAIFKTIGEKSSIAMAYHRLGTVAEHRWQLDEAQDWYKRALGIKETLGDQHGIASTYHQLGSLAQRRGQMEDAEKWYTRSLTILYTFDAKPHIAVAYHRLGNVAQSRGRVEEAEEWYKKSLDIREALGDRLDIAMSYGQLGMLAQHRGQLEEAENWYKRFLDVCENLGDLPDMAPAFASLGRLRAQNGDFYSALRLAIRSCAVYENFLNPNSIAPIDLARYWRTMGREAIVSAWKDVTGTDLPRDAAIALELLSNVLKVDEKFMKNQQDLARAAAALLATKYGAELPIEVEKALLAGSEGEPGQFGLVGDLANVAMAIIAAAALGWTISNDLEQDKRLTREIVSRELRKNLKTPETLAPEKREQIIIIITDLVLGEPREEAKEADEGE